MPYIQTSSVDEGIQCCTGGPLYVLDPSDIKHTYNRRAVRGTTLTMFNWENNKGPRGNLWPIRTRPLLSAFGHPKRPSFIE
jgi:hypothetical protein